MKKKISKRTVKNIIIILMIAVLGAGSYFTMDYAASQSSSSGYHMKSDGAFNGGPQSGGGDSSSSQPPEMPNGGQNENGQPPEMPNGGQNENGQPPEMPNGGQNENGQPPEMPNGGASNSDGSTSDDPISSFGSETESESADVTDTSKAGTNSNSNSGKSGSDNNSSGRPEMPSNMKRSRTKSSSVSALFYIVFAVEALFTAALILYLIMSGFNKKGFKETLKGWKRIVIYALSVAIVTGCLTVIQGQLTTKYFASSSSSSETMQGGPGGEMHGGSSQTSVDANGATSVDGKEETLSESYSSTSSDESAILVNNGGNATVDSATITKTGDSTNTENSEFYGVNSAVLVQSGSTATIKGATINTDAKGANAVFATGENAKIYISDSTITSTGASSARGLDATYGGYIEADNVTITTQGGSCASLATDRGEGTVIAKNSTLETNGSGSPVIYSTGNISIEKTTGTANGSQMVVIEGKNSATVTSSTLTASGKGNRNDVDKAGVMIYQSMSGDASEGTGTFTATDSTLEIQSNSDYYKTAPMFFITNTDAVINLNNTKLIYGSNILISAEGTSEWGNEGSNGGNVTLNAENQTLTGDINADKISTVAINLTSSSYEGAINSDNSAKEITLKLDKASKIKLTGDTYVTSLEDEDETYSNIDFGSYTLYVNGKAIN